MKERERKEVTGIEEKESEREREKYILAKALYIWMGLFNSVSFNSGILTHDKRLSKAKLIYSQDHEEIDFV